MMMQHTWVPPPSAKQGQLNAEESEKDTAEPAAAILETLSRLETTAITSNH